ncbi:hypothetical protein SCA6_015223 [Theobroma cacao]
MQGGVDFLNCLDGDLSIKILMSLEDPADLVRLGAVSRSWRHFVITNGLCKNLCRRMFPQFSRLDCVNELIGTVKRHAEAGPSNFMEWEALEREHRVFAFLARGCLSFGLRDCISEAIIASSTDNYPEESIDNTLEPRDRVARIASYWSSKGQSNPEVPETLTYKLAADLCVITDINIRPFQAYFQFGYPIYSAKSVRFRTGHIKSSVDNLVDDSCQGSSDNKYAWTYTSQDFPMSQENRLQNFRLPEPVLCIGGILQVELLGRVQRQDMDGLFYICVSHVQVLGRPLSLGFNVQILEPSEKFVLEVLSYAEPTVPEQPSSVANLHVQIVNLLGGNVDVEYEYGLDMDDEDSDEDEEVDEE